MKLCAKGLVSCPLLNICGSNFLVLLKSYTYVFQECEKIVLKQMPWSFVFSQSRLVDSGLECEPVHQEADRPTLIVPVGCLRFGK